MIDKTVLSANNSVSSEEDWIVEVNKPIKTGKGKKEIIKHCRHWWNDARRNANTRKIFKRIRKTRNI